MFLQILKIKRLKWAILLVIIAVLVLVGSIRGGSLEALPFTLVLLALAALLILPEIKAIRNHPTAPTLSEQDIHVSQEALDAFNTYGTLPVVENSPVILVDGEQAVYACRAERVETKNRRLGATGSGGGASIRVSKRVTLRTGGTGSQSIYGDVEMVHSGEFVVTTSRIVFIANNRSFEEKMSKISAVSVDDGCLAIMTAKANYSMRMPMPEYPCEIIKHCIKAL